MHVTFEIDIILARASPLKPSVLILNRSSSSSILLVACFENANKISSG